MDYFLLTFLHLNIFLELSTNKWFWFVLWLNFLFFKNFLINELENIFIWNKCDQNIQFIFFSKFFIRTFSQFLPNFYLFFYLVYAIYENGLKLIFGLKDFWTEWDKFSVFHFQVWYLFLLIRFLQMRIFSIRWFLWQVVRKSYFILISCSWKLSFDWFILLNFSCEEFCFINWSLLFFTLFFHAQCKDLFADSIFEEFFDLSRKTFVFLLLNFILQNHVFNNFILFINHFIKFLGFIFQQMNFLDELGHFAFIFIVLDLIFLSVYFIL